MKMYIFLVKSKTEYRYYTMYMIGKTIKECQDRLDNIHLDLESIGYDLVDKKMKDYEYHYNKCVENLGIIKNIINKGD